MKHKKIYTISAIVLILLAILIFLFFTNKIQYIGIEKSKNTFLEKYGGKDYAYSSAFSSWTGFGYETTIYVSNGRVVRRDSKVWDSNSNSPEEYSEKEDSLGSHDYGSRLLTVEQIYDRCKSEVLTKDPLKNKIYIQFNDEGILEDCSYRPIGCMDDCSFGYYIYNLRLVE